MKVTKLSPLADQFPSVEVEYEDMLEWQHKTDARGGPYTDCLGVVVEVFRRAGIALPPARLSGGVTDWYRLFDRIDKPEQLYDVIYYARSDNTPHVWIVIRPGCVISSTRGANVNLKRLSQVVRDGCRYYRLRPDALT